MCRSNFDAMLHVYIVAKQATSQRVAAQAQCGPEGETPIVTG